MTSSDRKRALLALALPMPLAVLSSEGAGGAYVLVLGLGAVVLGGRGIRRNAGSSIQTWRLIHVGSILLLASLVVRLVHSGVSGAAFPFPSPADILAVAGYLAIVSGLVVLARQRHALKGNADYLDALVAGVLVTSPLWLLVLNRHLVDSGFTTGYRALNLAYGLIDIALIAVTIRLAAGPGRRNAALGLFAGSVASVIALDTLAIVDSTGIRVSGSLLLLMVGWAFTGWAAAVQSEQLAALTRRPEPRDPRLSGDRAAVVAAAILAPPVIAGGYVVASRGGSGIVPLVLVTVVGGLGYVRVRALFRAREHLADLDQQVSDLAVALLRESEPADIASACADSVEQMLETKAKVIEIDLDDSGFHHRRDLDPTTGRSDWDRTSVELPEQEGGDVRGRIILTTDGDLIEAEYLRLRSVASLLAFSVQVARLRETLFVQRADRRFRGLVNQSSDMILVLDRDAKMSFVSPEVERLFPNRVEDLLGRHATELFDSTESSRLMDLLANQTDDDGQSTPRPFRLVSDADSTRLVEISARSLHDDPEVGGLVVTGRDVTDRWEAEQELKRREHRFRSLVQNSTDVIMVVDSDINATYVSPSVERILGYAPDELIGNGLQMLLPEGEIDDVLRRLSSLVESGQGTARTEVSVRDRSHQRRLLDVAVTDLRDDPYVAGYVVNGRDITEATQLRHDLVHASNHDALTGLPNRNLFKSAIEDAIASAGDPSAVTVIILDLDDFKTVNDGLGHDVGDEVLRAVSGRLQHGVRLVDTAARLSGDEFGILVPDASGADEIDLVVSRLLSSISEPVDVQGRQIRTAATMGIVRGSNGVTAEVLLRDADIALYEAKGGQRGGWKYFERRMQESVRDQMELKDDLSRAAEASQLELVYQPLIDVESGRTIGVEALLRWNHPTRGLVSPDQFIPIAEESGAIHRIGMWVLDAACSQLADWRRVLDIPDFKMSVNLSAVQLPVDGLHEQIAQTVAVHEIPADRLTLEITEGVLLDETDESARRLRQLKATGVELAIDDFGTGYAGLGYLQRYEFDLLKIDRTFVSGIDRSESNLQVTGAVVDLAHRLGVPALAEGVETESELAILKSLECEFGQGYLFSRPTTAHDVEERLIDQGAAVQELSSSLEAVAQSTE